MFYSHEVLTSRKYGVATVWLIATLGSKSTLKKINRKAILDVNVPKACQTIQAPDAPMALRLQSNLLYGVSRVYLQQCGYVLADAQNAHNAMRTMMKIVRNAELDPEAGKARRDQLILEDDPSFLPDFALLPLDHDLVNLANLTISLPDESQRSDSLLVTPYGSQNFHHEQPLEGSIGGLIIPSSDTGDHRDIGGFAVQGDDGRGTSRFTGPSSIVGREDDGFQPDADFGFDAEGNLFEFTPVRRIRSTSAAVGRPVLGSDAVASAKVRKEHEEGLRVGADLGEDYMDVEMPNLGNDFDILPEGEAFPSAIRQASDEHTPSAKTANHETSSTIGAPMRHKRRPARIIPLDQTMELRNSDLSRWNTDYLQNMAEATRVKMQHKAVAQAKKNAEFWIWGSGIGNVGRRFGHSEIKTPFDMFYGDALFEAFTGINRVAAARQKRDRDSGIDEATEGESRRIRRRLNEDEVGRGDNMELDEGVFAPMGDEDVEMPRDAPSALDDQQLFSTMPWNISASIRGSSVVRGRSALPGLPGSLSRRMSRMVSASPLHDRGRPGGLEALRSLEGEDEFGSLSGEDFGYIGAGTKDDLDLYADPPPIESRIGQKVLDALDAEGINFLAFVHDGIEEKRKRLQEGLEADFLQAEAAADVDEVLFEELLPPQMNLRVVAAQALLHTLSLATKGLLTVRQDEHFGEIGLRVVKTIEEADIV
ncbi:hypothetical protein AOQ84DRAFT_346838 [Glonium stellatum]|uniref:Rad21/Rec8-like protein N-terminal domain-containing protein n=1 Tax=Glonium stellatum TaxID=574774 RepID=A0A8E2EST5_9PEZI|nr:hypothetical protein AOQ84DRAFT_346838 [Glonium stellatum]